MTAPRFVYREDPGNRDRPIAVRDNRSSEVCSILYLDDDEIVQLRDLLTWIIRSRPPR